MFRSIRWRIILPFVGLILVSMLGLEIYLNYLIRQASTYPVSINTASLQRVIIAAVVAQVLMAFIISAIIAAYITSSFPSLTQSAWQLAGSSPGEQTFPSPADEISQLAQAFNLLSTRLDSRANDLETDAHAEDQILLSGENIFGAGVDVMDVRRRVDTVFQRPNPFPKSIYDNVAYGPRLYGISHQHGLDEIVYQALLRAALWDEVKDKLHQSATALSGRQQQRLCIARTLAMEPEVILLNG